MRRSEGNRPFHAPLLACALAVALLAACGGGNDAAEIDAVLASLRADYESLETFRAKRTFTVRNPAKEKPMVIEQEVAALLPDLSSVRTFRDGEPLGGSLYIEGATWSLDPKKKVANRYNFPGEGPFGQWMLGLDDATELEWRGLQDVQGEQVAVLYGTTGHSKRTWWVRREPWEVVRVLQEGPAPGMGMEWVTSEMLRDDDLDGVSFEIPEDYELRDASIGKEKREEEGKRKRAAHRETLFGKPAPGFEAPDLDGEIVRLSELRGQVVLVNFWGTWCIPCMAEIPELQKIQDRHRDAGFVILAIDHEPEPLDDPQAPRKTMERLGASLRVVPATAEIMDAYIPPHYPTNVLIDREGVVRYLSSGYEPGGEEELEAEIRKLL